MKNFFIVLYKLDLVKISHRNSHLNSIILKNIVDYFKEHSNLLVPHFSHETSFSEFFLIEYETTLYFLITGEKFLQQNWHIEIQNFLSNHINNCLKKSVSSTNELYKYHFLDYTYTINPEKKKVASRRLRSISGGLRRIFCDIKISKNKNCLNEYTKTLLTSDSYEDKKSKLTVISYHSKIQVHTIFGDEKMFDQIYLAVKANRKLPNLRIKNSSII